MEEYVTKETHYWSCRAGGISWRSTLLKRHITGAVERGDFMEECWCVGAVFLLFFFLSYFLFLFSIYLLIFFRVCEWGGGGGGEWESRFSKLFCIEVLDAEMGPGHHYRMASWR